MAIDVDAYVESIVSPKRRRDAATLIDLMGRVTGQPPHLSSTSIVGFGRYEWHYESGRKGEGPAASFASRKAATVIYLPDGIDAHADDLRSLGEHTSSVSCLYLKDLTKVDLAVLEHVIAESYATLTAGTFRDRGMEPSAPGGS